MSLIIIEVSLNNTRMKRSALEYQNWPHTELIVHLLANQSINSQSLDIHFLFYLYRYALAIGLGAGVFVLLVIAVLLFLCCCCIFFVK